MCIRDRGNYNGIDVDVCRAISAAVFGDPTKLKFTPLTAKERLTALQSGEIDVLSRNTTWTSSRDSAQGDVYKRQDLAVLRHQSEIADAQKRNVGQTVASADGDGRSFLFQLRDHPPHGVLLLRCV